MSEKCKECSGSERCVPFFDVQNTLMHYNWANRRMLLALITVCVTAVILVIVFATNQTKREQMWQETIKSMYESTVSGVGNGENGPDH